MSTSVTTASPPSSHGRRVAAGVFVVATASFGTVAFLSQSRPWLRIMVAPAWIAGATASGNPSQPSSLVLLLAVLVFAAALALLAARALPKAAEHSLSSRRAAVTSLAALLAVLVLEAACARPIARSLRNLTGVPEDVGSEFPGFLALRLVPSLLGFAGIAIAVTLVVIRFRPRAARAVRLGLWVLNFLLVLACFSWYFSPHVP